MDGNGWVDADEPGWIRSPKTDAEWDQLVTDYGGDPGARGPFKRVVRVARDNGCSSVVIENRYVDPDYRSEYSGFWSARFTDRPAFARRVHFFKTEIFDHQLAALPAEAGYLGYSVLRPIPLGRVGRTVLVPPPSLAGAMVAQIEDQVTLFGSRLVVRGAPFIQQDTEFLRCAHAAAWMCHYAAACRGQVARQLTAAFADASPKLLSLERALPSKGLTPHQVQAVFEAFGQPALVLDLNKLPTVQGVNDPAPKLDADGDPLPGGLWDTRIFSIICRYLNSGFPVFVGTTDHAFTVVGWRRDAAGITFFLNDDARGPYMDVPSPFTDTLRAPWLLMMVPLPPKVFLSGESAENTAYTTLTALSSVPGASPRVKALGTGLASGDVRLVTLLRDASEYKIELANRALDPAVVSELRLARLPHYIWAVEAHDHARCSSTQPCVVGEVILDSTSHDSRPRHDAVVSPDYVVTLPPDDGKSSGARNKTHSWNSQLDSVGAGH